MARCPTTRARTRCPRLKAFSSLSTRVSETEEICGEGEERKRGYVGADVERSGGQAGVPRAALVGRVSVCGGDTSTRASAHLRERGCNGSDGRDGRAASAHVGVSGGRVPLVPQLAQQPHRRVEPPHDRVLDHRAHGRQRRRLRERHEVLAEREPDALVRRVDEQDPRAAALVLDEGRGELPCRLHRVLHRKEVHRAREIRHEREQESVGKDGSHAGVDQRSREEPSEVGVGALASHSGVDGARLRGDAHDLVGLVDGGGGDAQLRAAGERPWAALVVGAVAQEEEARELSRSERKNIPATETKRRNGREERTPTSAGVRPHLSRQCPARDSSPSRSTAAVRSYRRMKQWRGNKGQGARTRGPLHL